MPPTAPLTSRPLRVGIIGHFGFCNLGDEAVVKILIAKVREFFPGADICAFSLNPRDTERRHSIQAFPIRRSSETAELFAQGAFRGEASPARPGRTGWKALLKKTRLLFVPLCKLKTLFSPLEALLAELSFLRRSYSRLRGLHLLVVPGSGQLNDFWGGPWRHPYTLLSFGLLAKVSGVPLVVLSVGAGQLNTFLGKRFCKWFLALTSYRSFRDRHSRELMGWIGSNGEAPVFPDQGFAVLEAIEHSPPPRQAEGNGVRPIIVGLNLVSRHYYLSPGADEAPHRNYLESLSSFLTWLIREGHRICFCPSDFSQDVPVLERIKDLLGTSHGIPDLRDKLIERPIRSVEELIEQIRLSDLMIASRFHGVVFPLAFEIPVLGISYSRKIKDLLCEVGQGDYCLDLRGLRSNELQEKFQALLANRESIRERLRAKMPHYLAAVRTQYRDVFSSLKLH